MQDPRSEQLTALAHRFWQERGCPEGSPELDWARAERELHRTTPLHDVDEPVLVSLGREVGSLLGLATSVLLSLAEKGR